MDVFPIPPAPMRAIGVLFSARPMIFSINSLRPKHDLGGWGASSPGMLRKHQIVDPTIFKITDLARVYGMVSIPPLMEAMSHLLADADSQFPDLATCCDVCPRPT